LVLVKFALGGNLRFLSHLEQMVAFQRACVRAGVDMVYTQGFNPHPIISIPLPRSVGVESDDDYFCLRIKDSKASFDSRRFQAALSTQMPAGFKLNSVCVSQSKKLPFPQAAVYFLPTKSSLLDDNIRQEKLKSAISGFLASASLIVPRKAEPKRRRVKNVDVRGFIDDIILQESGVAVRCKIYSGGTIRVDEILALLGLSVSDLSGPVRRTSVQWKLDS
jgi:radical SAM-linked protein